MAEISLYILFFFCVFVLFFDSHNDNKGHQHWHITIDIGLS